ncbi:hypothetical protein F5148DRAFT_1193395 [Russula earlei]|uniref:Uncharacterized protein n=1 Tax=Russula earlei TaxID=71964 RepID=A0ACC0UBH7_9AGAM|nr:hypothetical protein F5148DRAFT_1193395 [Russula earlei]
MDAITLLLAAVLPLDAHRSQRPPRSRDGRAAATSLMVLHCDPESACSTRSGPRVLRRCDDPYTSFGLCSPSMVAMHVCRQEDTHSELIIGTVARVEGEHFSK